MLSRQARQRGSPRWHDARHGDRPPARRHGAPRRPTSTRKAAAVPVGAALPAHRPRRRPDARGVRRPRCATSRASTTSSGRATSTSTRRSTATPSPTPGPPSLQTWPQEFCSPEFVAYLEKLTGIDDLIPDWTMDGGGLHQTLRGGHLNIHADFTTHHTHENWARRVNILLYLNEEWHDEWGGKLELWDTDMTACQGTGDPGRQPDAGLHHRLRHLPRPPRRADLPARRGPALDGALLLHRGGARRSAGRPTTRPVPRRRARRRPRSPPTARRSTSTTGSSAAWASPTSSRTGCSRACADPRQDD